MNLAMLISLIKHFPLCPPLLKGLSLQIGANSIDAYPLKWLFVLKKIMDPTLCSVFR